MSIARLLMLRHLSSAEELMLSCCGSTQGRFLVCAVWDTN